MIGPPHRAAFRPTHQRRLPTTAPQIRQYATLPIRAAPPRAAHAPKHEAARAHGQGPVSPRQGHTTRASLVAESTREIVGPTGRPPPSVAAPRVDAPNK